jgi:hypothetical protein
MKKRFIEHPNYRGYDRRDAMANGNAWVKWLVGALWFVIITSIITIISTVACNDKDSRTRDISEAQAREQVNCEVVRIDTNQKEVMTKLKEVANKQESMSISQAVMVNNQEAILNTLKEIKQRIK